MAGMERCKFKQENQSKASENSSNFTKQPWLEMAKVGIVHIVIKWILFNI